MGRFTTITRDGTVRGNPEQIVALLASTAGYTEINPYRTGDPALSIEPFGPASGVGAGFAFNGRDGKGTQTVAAVRADGIDFDIDMGAMGKSRQSIDLTPAQDGATRVTWSAKLDAGHNPVLRIFGLVAHKILGPSLESGIANLAGRDWR
ncbi:MAG: SRPBCC family protein [Nocardioides sp.]|uniref:SRPBCC family protein n=1 Tax=Nocardioides sp. TaxID=35761 RepID=UPI0039E4BBED